MSTVLTKIGGTTANDALEHTKGLKTSSHLSKHEDGTNPQRKRAGTKQYNQ